MIGSLNYPGGDRYPQADSL